MKLSIENRELFALDTNDGIVIGTYHKAYDEKSISNSTSLEEKRLGVLFLNSLTPTRSATGDSAVYWADALAESGYPSLRIDLAGLGDSTGNPPADLLGFINTGGYASLVSTKVSQLMERFSLSGFIIVGLCAGAVSALYTAAACKDCKGVILMDPYFHLPLANKTGLWAKVIRRLSRTSIGVWGSNTYDRLRAFRAQLPGTPPPSNANFPLLNCWKSVASGGTPILILKAQHTKMKIGDFDYLSYIFELAGQQNEVVVEVIDDTGHSFANRVGRLAVRQTIERWLNSYFPLKTRKDVIWDVISSELSVEATNYPLVGTRAQN
ncbi:alpha/beta hydrolase [Tunturiibacter lichenicola]|jgi:pimeloyl-ACP methyl ester carboxylesterase|uniref:alpha/beta hydrolase n=1 Tax=Tunturiibacter lichenicola TaxID=2051959 RepID=UPI0021B33965|nr:alpha/beta hydrolase [Edaphobacter lichenicola]